MKVLITGATGNLGSATIDFLSKKMNAANISALELDITDQTLESILPRKPSGFKNCISQLLMVPG